MVQIVLTVLAGMLGVMVAAWAFSLTSKNGGWTDVFWTVGSGATLALAAIQSGVPMEPAIRQWTVAGLLAIWAVRRGLLVIPRVANEPEPLRFAEYRQTYSSQYPIFMFYVTLPLALATALMSISVVLAAGRTEVGLGFRDFLGIGVFAVALVGESIADWQMQRFRSNPTNADKVMDQGLWAWSRHPNYFFEWLGWFAYPIIAVDIFRPITLLSFVAPAVMYLLLRHVTGVPALEAAMLRSRGDLYRTYQDRVGAFFPNRP